MNIQIICIGKSKEKYFIEPFLEYRKRLSPYTGIELIELPATQLTNSNNVQIVKQQEKQRMMKLINPSLPLIVLSEEGQLMNSQCFAQKINDWQLKGTLQFVIGGTYGIDEELKQSAHLLLSFSKMTFTHEMIRIFLIEQIYRAFMINHHKKYHY
ncbi:MAG TPA: 23S rRNA (pseudouridine(1915)-N(3))-methyltransferase RlmH [Candidatus Cloacimonadota bacterium]|jgi:23S rRNA (pseudouridine1915-N3)-methyltransferase|nr:23S rRNA (pseudouridine(1915)-N(3))-methyltransferase RlmH [Candidatus Cloacimonadota bacterium]